MISSPSQGFFEMIFLAGQRGLEYQRYFHNLQILVIAVSVKSGLDGNPGGTEALLRISVIK